MTKQELEKAKAIEKSLKGILKQISKTMKWSYKDSVLFKVENGFFFEVMITCNRSKKTIDTCIKFKPCAIDDLFWDIFNLPENKKQPLSFRAFGVFTVNSFSIDNWQEEYNDIQNSLDELCIHIVEKSQKTINNVLIRAYDLKTYIAYLNELFLEHKLRYPGSVIDINLELILSEILLGDINSALKRINERLESNDKGKFLNSDGNVLKGIYDYAKEYCANAING